MVTIVSKLLSSPISLRGTALVKMVDDVLAHMDAGNIAGLANRVISVPFHTVRHG